MDLGRDGGSGEIEERRGDVDVGDQGGDFGARLKELGITDEEGDADGLVEGPALIAEAVLAPEVAVIACEDEDGVVELFRLFERGEELADTFVDRDDAAELVPDEFVLTAAAGLDFFQGGLVFEVIGGVGGDFDGFGFKQILVAFGGGEGAVDGFVADICAEGLGTGFFDELGGVVGEDIRDVAGGLGFLAVDVEGGIVVYALAAEGDPAVEAGAGRGVVAHVPFAEVAGFVAARVEEFGEGFEFVADGGTGEGVADDAMGLDVLAGEETASAGGAEGGGDEGVRELGAFAGDAVDVWCFEEGVAGVAEGVPAHVVDEDEDEIGFGGCLGEEGGGEEAEGLATGESGHGTYLTSLGLAWGDEKLEYWGLSAGPFVSRRKAEFGDASDAWYGTTGEIAAEILQVIVKVLLRVALRQVIREFVKISEPLDAILPIDISRGRHTVIVASGVLAIWGFVRWADDSAFGAGG